MAEGEEDALRIDVWLWRARFFKTRGLALKAAEAGFRLNGARSEKAHAKVRPGDALTFRQAGGVRVVRVRGLGARRGPASEAAELYEDLDPPAQAEAEP